MNYSDLALYTAICGSLGLVLLCALFAYPDRWQDKEDSGALRWGLAALLLFCVSLPFYHVQPEATFSSVLSALPTEPIWTTVLLCWLGYLVVGLVWSVAYFGIYARRLGQQYILARDAWLQANGVADLGALSPEQIDAYKKAIQTEMHSHLLYEGDFPLNPFQQKRFFLGSASVWPISMLIYFVGDLLRDVAQAVWFAIRDTVHAYWASHMALALADQALCLQYRDLVLAARVEQQPEPRLGRKRLSDGGGDGLKDMLGDY